MQQHLRTEEIYDAATDAGLFATLAGRVADSIGARSGVLHWRPRALDHEEVSYSGYFTLEQMALYAEHFAGDDLWAAAFSRASALDRVWRLDELVPAEAYEKGRLYNEWIRPMGDDSFHCIGGALDMGAAVGEFGFHRGRGQPAFGEAEIDGLTAQLPHLRRMFAIRHRLWQAERAEATVSQAQDLLGHALFTLSPRGQLLHGNRAAEALLARGDGLALRAGQLTPVLAGDRDRFAAMLAAARSGCWAGALLVGRRGGGHYLVSAASTWSDGERRVVLIVNDPDSRDLSLGDRLRMLYRLSESETEIALGLAEGKSPAALAAERRTAVETVRNQIKAVSAKLGCSRQSEIVALVASIPKLCPNPGR
jgi:DNA-binding CsgD family transcriptional regulator